MSKNKPRIAFCFSWQARTLDQTYIFFQKNLFDAAKEQWFDYDVFCAVEDDEDVDKVKLLNPTKIKKIKSSDVEEFINIKYPDYIKEFLENYCLTDLNILPNTLNQFYKVQESILLMDKYWKQNKISWDIVVKLRFDFLFFNKLNYCNILKIVINNNIICNKHNTPKYLIKFWEINDFFFFGNYHSMVLLWSIFDDFVTLKFLKKIKSIYKPFFYFFGVIKKFFIYINNLLKHWILPVWLIRLFESIFYEIYTPELIYYQYFIYHKIPVLKRNFSYMLIRKQVEKSIIRLEQKNEFEL